MATAVSTNTGSGASEQSPAGGSGGYSVYKPGEGYATRLGLMVIVMAYVFFAARQWYYNWVFARKFIESIGLGFLTNWSGTTSPVIQMGGTTLVAVGGLLLGYYYIYIKPASAEFLIKTDIELGKVTWPKISPWFKADTQVWGATYVVLIVIAAMTLYVFAVDVSLKKIADFMFYNK